MVYLCHLQVINKVFEQFCAYLHSIHYSIETILHHVTKKACFLTITGEIQILPAYVRSLTVRDRDCYLKRLTLTDETRLADPTHALTQRIDDLTGFPPVE